MRLFVLVALIAGTSAFAPSPSDACRLRRSPSESWHRRTRPRCGALSAKQGPPMPREDERDDDFDSDDLGEKRVACLSLGVVERHFREGTFNHAVLLVSYTQGPTKVSC